jgi:hypothetical protein
MDTNRISMRLEDIARKHGTLKVQHGYMPIYERFFQRSLMDVLEIGVHEGASLKTWREWFPHGSYITGIDKSLTNFDWSLVGVKVVEADAQTWECDRIYDIIIDDGSHIGTEQIATFNNLWPSVHPGGWYVVEDLFAAYDPVWNPYGPIFIDMIQARMKDILIGGDSIQEVHWFGRNDINGILFLRKRYEPFRIQPLTEFQ